ncbi:MAG: MerR family transcriptional regulator, partial [Comamonadaceae bacterium]
MDRHHVFTSKEILERTGISRATLNNYISSGLLPRPDVLPPDPADGSAPRIGYFPDDTITRILEIQRLKSEGWSMGRIAQHFAGGGSALPVPAATPLAGLPAAAPRLPAETVEPGGFFEEVDHPAYGLGPGFELLWANAAVQGGVVGRLLGWPSTPPWTA